MMNFDPDSHRENNEVEFRMTNSDPVAIGRIREGSTVYHPLTTSFHINKNYMLSQFL